MKKYLIWLLFLFPAIVCAQHDIDIFNTVNSWTKTQNFANITADSANITVTIIDYIDVEVIDADSINTADIAASAAFYLADDKPLFIGNGTSATVATAAEFLWETADANANCLQLILPEGGTRDVPVFFIGDSSWFNKDIGVFNGRTQPLIAIGDDDRDSHVGFGFASDDVGYIGGGGSLASINVNSPLNVSQLQFPATTTDAVYTLYDVATTLAHADSVTINNMIESIKLQEMTAYGDGAGSIDSTWHRWFAHDGDLLLELFGDGTEKKVTVNDITIGDNAALPTVIAGRIAIKDDSLMISVDGSTWLHIVTQARATP